MLSPRTKRVIELAEDEAQAAGSRQVGDEHLLLGLVREGEGMASGILLSLGVALERIREELLERRGPTAS